MEIGKDPDLIIIVWMIQGKGCQSFIHHGKQAFRSFRVREHGCNFFYGNIAEKLPGKGSLYLFRQAGIEEDSPPGHLLSLINRHPGMIFCGEEPVIINEKTDPFSHFRPGQDYRRLGIPILSPLQPQAFPVIVRLGIIRPGQGMAPPSGPITVFYKVSPFFLILMQQIKGIGRQAAVTVRASPGKEGIDLILGDEHGMFLPGKAFPGIKRDRVQGELLKTGQNPFRVVKPGRHDAGIFPVSSRKARESLHQFIYPGGA